MADDNWANVTVDTNGSVGNYSSLTIDINGNPYISYYDSGNETLKYAYCTSNCETDSNSWTKLNVTLADDGKFSSIGLDKYSNLYISYYNSSELKIASYLSQTDYDLIEAAPDITTFTGDETTNLGINTGINLLSVSNFTVENQWGKVQWIFPVNISPVDFVRLNISKYLGIVHNNISLAIRYLPTLNRPAQLTFYNISMVYPDLIRNGEYCPAENCAFVSYEGSTLVYNVSRFSSYHAVDRAAPYIPSFLIFSFTALAAFTLLISIVLLKKGDMEQ